MKKILIAASCVAGLALPTAALADVAQEINTAATHAGLAAKAPAIDGVHMHMHHALNCLVGPKGDGFDSSQMNPCASQGNGAIPDASDAQKAKLTQAVATLKAGIASSDLATAAKDATDAAATIGSAK
ncbi:MAG TPA: hypothetical protein VG501_10690 [Rhizomicrobium sp.]|nr:hypothetical protein [Rhizomicrobium sp.]